MILSLECNGRRTVGYGSYHPNQVSFVCQTNCVPNVFSKCDEIVCQHVPLLNCNGFFSAAEIVLMLVLVEVRWILGHWSGHFTIWIMRSPLHVGLRCVFNHQSFCLLVTSPSVRPNLVVPPTFFSFAKCRGLPSSLNLDYLHACNRAPLSTVMQTFVAPNQGIFNQQTTCHCLIQTCNKTMSTTLFSNNWDRIQLGSSLFNWFKDTSSP